MKEYSTFELPENLEIIKTNKNDYYNIPCGFDIETTSTTHNNEKTAFAYIWMFGMVDQTNIIYGRTWEEFLNVCQLLKQNLDLHEKKRLIIYVHNLGYEFQFMRKYFTWLEVFAVAERKPIKAFCDLGIEFRDSYILSGFSLANTAKNLVSHKVNKLVGDLDYSLIRHQKTPLTPIELSYCKNDIAVILAYISEQMEIYGNITKIPLTNTGRVRNHVRNECYYTSKNHRKSSKSKYFKYRRVMKDLTLDRDSYIQLRRAFMGGFTHANALHVNQTLSNVSSIDFTSSYPAVMVSEMFPMSRFKQVDNITDRKTFDEYLIKYSMVFDVKFTNLKTKITQETYFSESKAISATKTIINNGRVVSAEEFIITLTDVDFEIANNVYTWEQLELSNVRIAHKNYLPKSVVKSILDLYQDKTTLKDVKGSETEYMLSKCMLNSIYGMCVTDIVKDNAVYDTEWKVEKVNIDDEIDNYNNSKTRFLFYAWGLWVTAYARRNLWTGILSVGNDYIYSDTDSLKLFNYNNHIPYIETYNANIIKKLELMCDYFKFDKKLLSPKTQDGTIKTIGIWDFEGTYSNFKTLGAKRYMDYDGKKPTITIAGLSKQNGMNYLLENSNNDINAVFKSFDDTLNIPADRTGKMTHTYIDQEFKHLVTDYQVNTCQVNPLTSIHLEKCEFTLSISDQYKNFLTQLNNGYILKGEQNL